MACSWVHIALVVDTQTDTVTTCCNLFEVCASEESMLGNWELVFFACAAIDAGKSAWAASRSWSAGDARFREEKTVRITEK